jgi:hypothetical protein
MAVQASILLHEMIHWCDIELLQHENGILTPQMCVYHTTRWFVEQDSLGRTVVVSACQDDEGNWADPESDRPYLDRWTEYTAAYWQGRFLGLGDCAAMAFGDTYLRMVAREFGADADGPARFFVRTCIERRCWGDLGRLTTAALLTSAANPLALVGLGRRTAAIAVALFGLGVLW